MSMNRNILPFKVLWESERIAQEVYYSDGMVEKNVTVEYQDIHRKQEVYKKNFGCCRTEQLMEYMKKWKLVD